jgi:hypothetical protein
MNRRTARTARAVAAAIAVLGLATVGSTAIAGAQTDDERFTDAVAQLGIPFAPDADVPQFGHRICETLTTGFKSNVNPVPTVRGVVTTLQNTGMTRGQAVNLMRMSVAVYCPEHGPVIGR